MCKPNQTHFNRCLTRFKNATATYPQLIPLVKCLCRWNEVWATGVSSVTPRFDDVLKDNKGARDHIISHLKGKMERLVSIVDREQAKFDRLLRNTMPTSTKTSHASNEGLLAALHTTYDGPGELRVQGPRHDNDFVDIQDIRVAPTHDELVCHSPPFLPANIYGAPHPLPLESMERLLDIQFRLLREELMLVSLRSFNPAAWLTKDFHQRPASHLCAVGSGRYAES
jgi:hypothetical protein